MSAAAWVHLLAIVGILAVLVPVTGRYLAAVYGDGAAPGDRVFGPIDRAVYRVCGIDESSEQRWTGYLRSLLAFSVVGFVVLYLILRFQGTLPGNPVDLGAVPAALAFNTTVSFVTNTNWQAYGGETTLSYFSQMVGPDGAELRVGRCRYGGRRRDHPRRRPGAIGDDRQLLGRPDPDAHTRPGPDGTRRCGAARRHRRRAELHGVHRRHHVGGRHADLPGGPAASQVSIKQLGTNGGGFFNVNSAHPFENPTPWSNLVEMVMILLIPLAFPIAYGRLVADRRQGRLLLGVMAAILITATGVAALAESSGNPELTAVGVDQSISADQGGGNLEGKEVRFGAAASGYWAAATTNTSNGSVNSMHDSFTPLGGGIALLSMFFGEVSPGGVGVGFMGLFIYALLAVFVAGLMVGRTPEYLGKKIQAAEMKLMMLYLLAMPVVVLAFSAISVVWSSALESVQDPGPHGLSEVLYAFGSGGNNNGSAFAGLGSDTPWFNGTIGVAMFVGRFFLIIPAVALAGSLAAKPKVPESAGTLPTHGPLFGGLVVGVVLIIAGLTFFPALALGPIVEQLSI